MLKKTMAVVLTLMMTAALAVPMVAVASGSSADYGSSDYSSASSAISSGQSDSYTQEYKTKTDVPTLNLTITGGGGLIMNPYGITRYSNDQTFGFTNNTSEQIISTVLTVKSTTELPVKVGAKVKATVTSDVTLATSKLGTSETQKKAALWLVAWDGRTDTQYKTFDRQTSNISGGEGSSPKAGVLFIKTKYVNRDTEVNVNDSMYTIPASIGGAVKTCAFRFVGDMVAEPKDKPWTPNDKIQPTLTLTFQLQKVGAGA